jgi:hypothetical protein
MKKIACQTILVLFIFTLAIPPTGGHAQAPASACGSQPLCYEASDFTATITSFRTSTTTSNVKVIDTTIRFQNKTNQQLILGYVISSGIATDDRGNRLAVGGPNGTHGIGLVAGGNFEPKFVLRPGGYGDATFELLAQGWPKVVGFTHALDMTIDEINSYEGNQHTLGGEFPLHFQGLTNGAAGSAPSLGVLTNAAANGPCGLANAQGAAGKASSAVSNAANTLSSLGSIFGRKKAAQNANQVASAAAGCDPRVNTVASTAGTVMGAAANSGVQQPQQVVAANAQQQVAAANAVQMPIGTDAQAVLATTAAVAPSGAPGTPAGMAADAYSKTKLAQQMRRLGKKRAGQVGQQVAPTVAQSPQTPQDQTAQNLVAQQGSPAGQAPVGGDLQGAQLQEQNDPNVMAGAPRRAVSAGKYDILGVKLGMPGKEAAAILHAHGLQLAPETVRYDFLPNPLTYGVMGLNQIMVRNNGIRENSEKVYIMLTMPPNQQVVSKVSRVLMFSKETAPTSDGLVADLVKKYGPPSYDSHPANLYAAGYRELYWVDDANGNRQRNEVNPSGGYSDKVNNCRSIPSFAPSATSYPNDYAIEADPVRVKIRLEKGFDEEHRVQARCADMTMIYARLIYGYPIGISAPDVVGGLVVVVGSAPMDRMATEATHNYLMQAAQARDNRQKQAAQKNKPAL